ncbi:MAG TPA: chromosomal replication initiator protein DnaA [SAR202 cluster bacterium]|jgi:chromosomal replication initiator protein|nr:chromosomal replication initiator protein DnaA [SAR202 cluster bacterium]|tara:strand:- start:347 stop:1777 length:1431 start_codon:yes stop_codon:yes gene_type:complete
MDRETIQKANKIWNSVLGKVELSIPKPSYDTWLRNTVGVSFTSNEFNVETPNAFTAQYLEDRMLDMLEQELRTTIGFNVKLKFTVINEIIPSEENEQSVTSSSVYSRSDQTAKYSTSNQGMFQDPNFDNVVDARIGSYDFNTRYTFENFIVGNSNQLAFAGAKAVSENPGTIFNPLVIHSSVGLGKTHLLQAIGHDTKKLGLTVIYVTSEEFTNQYVRAIQNGQTEEFRNKYRTVDVLLIDDIQFLIGKEQTQEGFFHTFNSLHVENKQIVVASDRNINELRTLESRITSRLTGGLVTDIQAPQLETRIAILRDKAAQQGYDIPANVIEFLGNKIRSNIRELEGLLNRVVALAQFRDEPITVESISRIVGDSERLNKEPISDSKIISEVSNYFGVTSDQIMGPLRTKTYLVPRQVAMFLLREETSLSLSAIGKILGGRDHSTVIHGHEKVASLINVDDKLRTDILAIRNNLTGTAG